MPSHAQYKVFFHECNSLLFLTAIIRNTSGMVLCAAGVILTVLLLVGRGRLASASLPNGLGAEQSCHAVVVPSAQLALLQPVCKQA
jgi:hypothetical protein